MATAFMRQGEPVAPLALGPLLGIEAFVDNDPAGFEPDRTENIWVQTNPAAGNIEQPVQIVELNVKLEVLLDDVLDRDRGLYPDAPGVGILRKQGLGIPLDGIVGDIGNSKSYPRFILICIVRRSLSARRLFFPRLLCLPRQPGHVFGRQTPRRPKEIGHFPRPLADDVS